MIAAASEMPASVREGIRAGLPPVRALRQWRGYGVTALAQASGVPAGRIAEHEAGRTPLSPAEREAIAAAIGVSPGVLTETR